MDEDERRSPALDRHSDSMQHILCFGDSNTWGYLADGSRLDSAWPAVLSQALPGSVRLTVDALPGRTAVSHAPSLGLTPGLPALHAHQNADFDWLLLMLGTNELARCFRLSAGQAAANVAELAAWALEHQVCRQLLLIAPPPIGKLSQAWRAYFAERQHLSGKLRPELAWQAQRLGCRFADAGGQIRVAEPDGLHLDATGHRLLGLTLAKQLAAL